MALGDILYAFTLDSLYILFLPNEINLESVNSIMNNSSVWFTVVASGALIVTPQNRVAMRGQRVKMQCQTDSGKKLKWFSQLPGSSIEEQIFSGFDFLSHAAHLYTRCNSSDGKQSICFNASADRARRYTCLEPGSLEVGSAEVIVLGECNCNR